MLPAEAEWKCGCPALLPFAHLCEGRLAESCPFAGLGGDAFCGVSVMLFRLLPLPSSLTVEEPDKIEVWGKLWQCGAAY